MGCAAKVIVLDDVRASQQRQVLRQQLHAPFDQWLDEIEAELRTRGKVDIPSREVGELVMDKLRGLDEVAYIRFASVYRSFMDLQEVKHEIDQLLSREKRG